MPPKQESTKPQSLKLILFVGLIFVLYVLVYHFRNFVGPGQTSTLSAGDLKKLYMAEVVLVRDETAIASPAGGQLVMLVQDGEKVRAGESIAEVKTMGGDSGQSARSALVRAPRSGVVISRTDGLEGVLNPARVDILEVAGLKLKEISENPRDEGGNSRCEKGQPVMKVVDNLTPLAMCLQAPEGFPADRIKNDGSISMVWENHRFTGRIARAGDPGGGRQLVIRTINYPGEFLRKRKVFLALEGETVSGFIVSVKSLVRKEGREGLYIMTRQGMSWVPVKVEGVVNDMAAVSGEQIVPGSRYMVNPRRLFAGDQV